MKFEEQTSSSIKFFIVVIGLTVIGIVLKELSNIFIPFVIAYFLFFVFAPLNSKLKQIKIPLFAIILLNIIITFLLSWGVSKIIIDSFLTFSESLPLYESKLNAIVRSASLAIGISDPFFTNFTFQNILSRINYQALVGNVFTSTFSVMGNILFILFFFVFVVSGHDSMFEVVKKRYVEIKSKIKIKKMHEVIPNYENNDNVNTKATEIRIEEESKIADTFKSITQQIQRYVITKIGMNLGAGVSISIILSIFGLDFAIIWGVFVFLFNFIPTIGSAVALIAPALMALIQSESVGYALLITGIVAGIQTAFFNLLEPMILGKRLNLNPLVILLSLLIWGYIWGIVGMLLSVPLTAIIKIILSNSESKNLHFISDLMSSSK
ncbi:MAG: AI-2E family transporter [Ignavibacteriaceae bacterium]|nr:AI-2E family transporter [Ignavibacteriaceae bacterium]